MDKKSHYKKQNRLWILGIIAVFFLMCWGGFEGFRLASHLGEGALVSANGNKIGGSFRVVSLGGSVVTEGDFRGDYFLIWFFDPRSPFEETRLVLKSLDGALAHLKQENIIIRPIMVSLQSDDLDIDDLQDYAMGVAPHIMPFYATKNMLQAMTHLYHAPFTLLKSEKGVAYYQAAPNFVLMNAQGHYVTFLPAMPSEEEIFRNLEKSVKQQ